MDALIKGIQAKSGYLNWKDGYLDEVFEILQARDHPFIVLEESAMMWMGINVMWQGEFDLLIRDSQRDSIINDLLASGKYDLVDQDLRARCGDFYAAQVPRLQCIVGEVPFGISLWTESVYFLSVDEEKIQIPNPIPYQAVLIEDNFNLQPHITRFHERFTERGIPFVPHVLAKGPSIKGPIYIPTITSMVNALLHQVRFRAARRENYSLSTDRAGIHVDNFVRYLHLQLSDQSKKLLSISKENFKEMAARLSRYKRKPTFDFMALKTHQLR